MQAGPFYSAYTRRYEIVKTKYRLRLLAAFSVVALLAVLALSTHGADSHSAKDASGESTLPPPSNGAISPQDQADALHFVIAADRDGLCRLYLTHMPAQADSGGGRDDGWPCPSVMLREACQSIQSEGAEFSYALRSLNPLESRNSPQTELEQTGLAFIESHPGQNYYNRETLGGRRYFTAVYPDLPAAASCVDCHNRKAGSSSRPHQAGDVLGGVVVRVPLEF